MHSRASETRQKWEGFGAAEHSDEVGETPASGCGLAHDSHLGRACAGAYRGEDECGGGLGAENGSLARPATSGGARPAMAPRRSLLLRSRTREERERGGDRMGCLGARGGVPTEISRSAGRPCPRRRRTAATWPASGGARWASARGREGRGNRAARLGWAEREAGRPSSACPLFFFLNFFSPKIFQTHFDKFRFFFSFGPQNKRCSK